MSRATFDGTPGTASSSSRLAARKRSAEPKWRRIARLARRARPRAGRRARSRSCRAPRRPRWWRSAKRCASSRMCCSTRRAAEPSSSSSGSDRPGRNTSSRFLARLTTGTSSTPAAAMPASAAASWPLPPSITTSPGRRGERRVVLLVVQAAEAAGDGLLHAGEVVRAALVAHREGAVVRLRRRRPLEDHHRGDGVALAEVRDVVALDPHRRRRQVEPGLQVGERVAAPPARLLVAPLVLVEREARVARGELGQLALVAARRRAHLDAAAGAGR